MDAETVINLALTAFLLLFAFVMWRFCRTPKPRTRAKARDVIAAARDSYEGPDSLRLMQELDVHLDAYFARLAHLFEELGPPPGPDPMDTGRERLLDAIHNDHTEGEA
jgi:hypothetical protein